MAVTTGQVEAAASPATSHRQPVNKQQQRIVRKQLGTRVLTFHAEVCLCAVMERFTAVSATVREDKFVDGKAVLPVDLFQGELGPGLYN